jgi:ABC-type multidrug transport system ATPase subunit
MIQAPLHFDGRRFCLMTQRAFELASVCAMVTAQRAVRLSEPVLSMRGVRKSFARGLARALHRTTALEPIDLDLWSEEILIVAGSEAAGKTTLLQCAAGLLRRDAGEVKWFGESFPGGGLVPDVAYVPAVPVFYPFLTVRDVLSYSAARGAMPFHNSTIGMEYALDALELRCRASQRVMTLTREEVKRLALADAFASNPRVLLIDSSTSDMSPAISVASCNAVRSFAQAGGAAVIAIRDASTVAAIATRLIFLSEGRITHAFPSARSDDIAMPLSPRFVAERLH